MASRAATEAWKRFASWYGADVLERKFGLAPPADWCEVFDGMTRDTLDSVMADVKQKFPTWMPGLPEFEALVKRRKWPLAYTPSVQSQLVTFVVNNRPLTFRQRSMTWTYLHSGDARTGENFAITGVEIPSDEDSPGYRVMVVDMQASIVHVDFRGNRTPLELRP